MPDALANSGGEVEYLHSTWEAVEQGHQFQGDGGGKERSPRRRGTGSRPRTQSRISCAVMGLESVRQAARRSQRLGFTARLHHITLRLLVDSSHTLEKNAAAGSGGLTRRENEKIPPQRVAWLHRRDSRRSPSGYAIAGRIIPKGDGRQRPLGIASIEGKVVQ